MGPCGHAGRMGIKKWLNGLTRSLLCLAFKMCSGFFVYILNSGRNNLVKTGVFFLKFLFVWCFICKRCCLSYLSTDRMLVALSLLGTVFWNNLSSGPHDQTPWACFFSVRSITPVYCLFECWLAAWVPSLLMPAAHLSETATMNDLRLDTFVSVLLVPA